MVSVTLSPADALAQLSFHVQRALEECASRQGLSAVQVRMLGILRDRTPLMSELGTRLGLDKSSISGLVHRAEKRGLVERFRSPLDGRAVHVRLTEGGRARAALGEADFEARMSHLLRHLGAADQRTLIGLVGTLLVGEDRDDDAAPTGRRVDVPPPRRPQAGVG